MFKDQIVFGKLLKVVILTNKRTCQHPAILRAPVLTFRAYPDQDNSALRVMIILLPYESFPDISYQRRTRVCRDISLKCQFFSGHLLPEEK